MWGAPGETLQDTKVVVPKEVIEKYELLEELGEGSYGKVFKVKSRMDGKTYAMKTIDYSSLKQKEVVLIRREVTIMSRISHTFVVRFIEKMEDRRLKLIAIIMEHCAGDMERYIKNLAKTLKRAPEDFVWKVLTEMLLVLDFFSNLQTNYSTGSTQPGEAMRMIHRDIKPGNILLTEDGDVKLGDFGIARVLNYPSDVARTIVGSPPYMSPEQVMQRSYDEKCDIWSLGCTIFHLCELRPPFFGSTEQELRRAIILGQHADIASIYSRELNDIIGRMLTVDNVRRPSARDLLCERRIQIIREQLQRRFDPSYRPPDEKYPQLEAMSDTVTLQQLQQIDEQQKQREAVLKAQEKELENKIALAMKKEQEIASFEQVCVNKERELMEREQRVLQREQEVMRASSRITEEDKSMQEQRKILSKKGQELQELLEANRKKEVALERDLDKERNEKRAMEKKITMLEGRLEEQHQLYREMLRSKADADSEVSLLKTKIQRLESCLASSQSDATSSTKFPSDGNTSSDATEEPKSLFWSQRREREKARREGKVSSFVEDTGRVRRLSGVDIFNPRRRSSSGGSASSPMKQIRFEEVRDNNYSEEKRDEDKMLLESQRGASNPNAGSEYTLADFL